MESERYLLNYLGLEVGWIRRIQELDTAYWGFLGVGTTLDIFQNIILIPYLEYGVLIISGYDGSNIAYLLIYVDDIILTALSVTLLQRIITSLHSEFLMTDLDPLHYFFGISVSHDAKPDIESKLGVDSPLVFDLTLYQSIADALQYLSFTRPNLSYAVQQIFLFMHDPREPHQTTLKRILCYVHGTFDYGLQLFSA
ncbi:ribonuclease H-like domain-containing protein [Tanacetum coccineum]